jgi:hypothetical protein
MFPPSSSMAPPCSLSVRPSMTRISNTSGSTTATLTRAGSPHPTRCHTRLTCLRDRLHPSLHTLVIACQLDYPPLQFTDWTNEEFRRQYHGHKPHSAALLRRAKAKPKHGYEGGAPDKEVDWRSIDGVVTPVKNQGGCGSCWAFSAVETLESHLAIATGKAAPLLSPQQMTSCAPNPDKCGGTGGCAGSTQVLGFSYTETAGISMESSYPYKATTGTCDPSLIAPVAKNTGNVEMTQKFFFYYAISKIWH